MRPRGLKVPLVSVEDVGDASGFDKIIQHTLPKTAKNAAENRISL